MEIGVNDLSGIMLSGIATIANPELIGTNSLDRNNVTFLHRALCGFE